MATAGKTRVLIVDDSALVRAILQRAISRHPSFEVVGQANDGQDALRKIEDLKPNVVTLDVEMPGMNGLQVLERVTDPNVVFLMCSTLTQQGARVTMEALRKGAFDYVTKPDQGSGSAQTDFQDQLITKVLAASRARGKIVRPAAGATPKSNAPTLPPCHVKGWVVAIGISCGGPQTLHEMLPAFPSDFPPIVITQHMPAGFTKTFAEGLARECAAKVVEAGDGEKIVNGVIYIAPGSHHLQFQRRGVDIFTRLDSGPKVSGHRPSADVMFSSLAKICGSRCVATVMTGMGSDGAKGLQMLHAAGAWTLAQDEPTSLVYGMPKVAAETGEVDHILPLGKIPIAISKLIQRGPRTTLSAAPTEMATN